MIEPGQNDDRVTRRERARAAHAAAVVNLDQTLTVVQAEHVVAHARHQDLYEEWLGARRRLTAARGLVTRARNSGDAAKLAAAEQRLRESDTEFERLTLDHLGEMHEISQAGAANLGEVFGAWDQKDAAYRAVLDTYEA